MSEDNILYQVSVNEWSAICVLWNDGRLVIKAFYMGRWLSSAYFDGDLTDDQIVFETRKYLADRIAYWRWKMSS